MDKKHIITIAGKLGSGKSSTAKNISEILNYKHYSTGDFMRSIANERGITLSELSKIAEADNSIDKALDDRNLEIGKMEDIVLDSRLGFYFIPDSFKVFLELDTNTASERILKDMKSNPNRQKEDTGMFDTKESIIASIDNRLLSERKRYKQLYSIEDLTSHNNFDLVIDTSNTPLHEVSKKIIDEYNNWLNN
ncbi:MAG: cytidylate kinase family protein [Candidatus Nomurabacteria bacterium]|nr:cytidylate kinase family protein [Candidatus Nomurabacteria bacterium]